MFMLEKVGFKNYKCFKDATEINIAPLTILCGVNSSGKSSVLTSLLTLKQSCESNSDVLSLALNGNYVNNGLFEDISYKKNKEPVIFETEFCLGSREKGTAKNEVRSFKELCRLYSNILCKMEDIERIKISFSCKVAEDRKAGAIVVAQDIKLDVRANNNKNMCTKIHLTHTKDKTYEIVLKNMPIPKLINEELTLKAVCYSEGLKIVSAYILSTSPTIKLRNNNLPLQLCTIFRIVSSMFSGIKHLAPLREYPKRVYLLGSSQNDIGISGENTPYVLKQNEKVTKRGLILPPKENESFQLDTKDIKLGDAVNSWLSYLGLNTYNISNETEAFKMDISGYNVANVGFGVSQALPIIAAGLMQDKTETLLLEQPEIHLHPRAQMNMADFLLSLACSGRNLIVETHSDHIINRLLRRMLEAESDNLINKCIKIYFVGTELKDGEPSTNIIPLEVDRVRGFVNAPEDFFSQFGSETNKIFNAGMQNLQRS